MGWLGKHTLIIAVIAAPDCAAVNLHNGCPLRLQACQDNERKRVGDDIISYEVNGGMDAQIKIEAINANDKRARRRFVDIGRAFAAATPNSVPQLLSEQLELVNPDKNPFFLHARVQFFIATRGGQAVGRISAHIDELAISMPGEHGFGPGTSYSIVTLRWRAVNP